MPTARQVRTSMDVLLPLIEARIALVTGLPAERVVPVFADAVPKFHGDHDVLLRLAGFSPDPGWQDGGGRITTRIQEKLQVCVRTRLALDASGEARQWLVSAAYGHLALRTRVLDALQEWYPEDEDGNALTTDPILLAPGSTTPPRADGPRPAANWGEERLTFAVNYLHDLTQANP